MIANEQRNERVSQERDRFGDIISTSTIRDFLASSGAPTTAFQGFNSLLTYTGGDPAAMQAILASLQAPAGPDNSPSANFNDLLRGMGPGASLVADKRNIPFIIDAMNLYFG
ncbi:MAG: hypothetical protein MN733_03945 [Nitrososphaera sp.]|nr:hypothetical protein [Nitrososphaera sp.]